MVETFLNSAASVAIILLLTATGYVCAVTKVMRPEGKKFISKLLTNVAIPAMCIHSLNTNLTREMVRESAALLLVPFVNEILCFLLSGLTAKLLRLPRKQFGVFMMMCSLSNCVFIGYAMCTELFGDAASPYVTMFYLVNTLFIQLVGIPLVRWSGTAEGDSGHMLRKVLCTPPVIGIITGIVLVALDIRLPHMVLSYCQYMKSLVSPLALLMTGFIIYEIGLKNLRVDRSMLLVMVFRFLLAPGVCFLMCAAFGIGGLGRSVFLVESAMPVVSMTVVVSTEYGADEQMAAQGAALTTIACFVVIPVLMMII
ncbi:AEC family transporter [Dysosmobacter sp.]|uniref:AEC family transporter n=1 Tax=Dysosmobacter sp. TaxID=2591382 RepID=UPI002A8BCA7B|nr:AEC family transporter [Dysosmobacter sp.]MDY3282788.1 AEC family transporter [Dysosmobacter sp.]